MMIQTQITHDQATKLAALVNALRPDWDKPGILDAIAKARTRGTAVEVCVAAVRCATSAQARTPAVIAMDGAHWREPERRHVGPVTAITGRCETCGQLHMPAEPCPPPRQQTQAAAQRRADEIRAQYAQAKARLCPCGVRPTDCADHDPARQPKPEETP